MKHTTQHFLPAFALAALFGAPLAAQKNPPPRLSPIAYGHAAAPDAAIRLFGSFATLRVATWDRDSIALIGEMPTGAALTGLVGTDPIVPNAKLNFGATAPAGGNLELRVPVRARLQIRAGVSEVSVTGVAGDLDVNVTGGSVHITGSPHVLTVDAMDASVTVDGSPEYLRLDSAAGDIVMTGGSPDARFKSVSGNIRVSGGAYERAGFETVEGGITFSGDFAPRSSLVFDTHSGNIELSLPAKSSVAIDAASFTGRIENLWSSARPTPARDGRGQELFADPGVGAGRAVIRSFKGTVRLMRR